MSEKPASNESEEAARLARVGEAAKRALDEAEARRRAAIDSPATPAEKGGPKGPEPTRYGDWEKGGITSDF